MDSSESPVRSRRAALTTGTLSRSKSVCYLFNNHGDCLGAKLCPGNVYSTEHWDELLLPEIAAAVGEDGWAAGEACAVLLAAAGRQPPDATPVRSYAPADLGAARARRLRARRLAQSGPASATRGPVSEKMLRNGSSVGWISTPTGFGVEDDATKKNVVHLQGLRVHKHSHSEGQNENPWVDCAYKTPRVLVPAPLYSRNGTSGLFSLSAREPQPCCIP